MNSSGYSYSFDDILLSPQFSNIRSRSDIVIKSKLTKDIFLNIPIISSPMDTVTESNMAIAMAIKGGLGIIHRFQNITDQVDMIKKVKREMSYVIDKPYTINENENLTKLVQLVESKKVSGILVVNNLNKFVGIVSKKDIDIYNLTKKHEYGDIFVKDIMTKKESVKYIKEYNSEIILDIFKQYKIEKIPILDKDDFINGLVIFKNFMFFHKNKTTASLDKNGKLLVGASIGVNGDYVQRATELVKNGVDILCIDVANGYNSVVADTIKLLKHKFGELPIMVGNVCTEEGYEFLCKAGADCIRIGIGSGSICSTRLQTGVGVCQFTALLNCSKMAKKYNVPMISDGGHTGKTGNKFKALAIGASFVLLGRSLAGTTESPGQILYRNGKRTKYYRGMASAFANLSKKEKEGKGKEETQNFHIEGVEGEIEYKGSVNTVLDQLCNGIKSGMSYLGAPDIPTLHSKKIEYTLVTQNGYIESKTRIN